MLFLAVLVDDGGDKSLKASCNCRTVCMIHPIKVDKKPYWKNESTFKEVDVITENRYGECSDITEQKSFEGMEMCKRNDTLPAETEQYSLVHWTIIKSNNGFKMPVPPG